MAETVTLSPKALPLLGLLRRGPMTGYDLHRVVRSHGQLYADLKKGNIYHLLDGLAKQGLLRVTVEPGARGRRGERLRYELTLAGRTALLGLIRRTIAAYEPADAGLASAVVFLPELAQDEAAALLRARRDAVRSQRAAAAAELAGLARPLSQLAAARHLALMDAELAWVGRVIEAVEAGA